MIENETPEERARRLGVPLIPKIKKPMIPNTEGVIAVCGECGLNLRSVMMYVCTRTACPTGLGSRARL